MAEDPIGQRKESKAPWTKIFTAFKVALDIKKLLLAAAGILAMAIGWWILAWVFYGTRSQPMPADYLANLKPEEKKEAWKTFNQARERWNLLHELAGDRADVKVDAGDVASSWEDYEDIAKLESKLEDDRKKEGKEDDRKKEGKPVDEIREALLKRPNADERKTILSTYGLVKPHGRLRTLPWFEDRGPNPYLVVADAVKRAGTDAPFPYSRDQFVGWLRSLVEPLVKFLSPVAYFFDARAGGWNRIYLILVILCTLAVWGFFGGAITRMAAVQVARNEKISMREALRFARERCQSFFFAPVFPLVFLGVLTFFLIVFGLVSGFIPILGDVLIAGLMWPLVIILGLVMAVVLVGLVGWPLMNPTISTEGSDSFDALSRSYSYVYQAPWHYLWYSAVSLAYGVALVFFVGLMGSLMVFLGEWGVRQAPFLSSANPANDREPTYLFVYAPTSFGWHDLLLKGSSHADRNEVPTPGGGRTVHYEMKADYMVTMKWYNYMGAFLVSVWLYLLFLLIVGFGYSFFWTASTIIYLLMRHKVDDTDLDEVHLDEEETEEPFAKDMTSAAPAPTPVPPKPASGGVTMVEPPMLRTPAAAPAASPNAAPTASANAAPAPAPTAPAEPGAPENKPAGDDGSPPANP
jgi:hypothetical protein